MSMGDHVDEAGWRFAAQMLGTNLEARPQDELMRDGATIEETTAPVYRYFLENFEAVQAICAFAGVVPSVEDYARMAAITVMRDTIDKRLKKKDG